MIDLHLWTTPNGYKPLIFLEEAELDYTLKPVDIGKGEQFAPDFLEIAPNNRIPAIVDHAPLGQDAPVSVFESGAILLYLAEKTGKFLPAEPAQLADVQQWLFWQMGGLGPMAGQNHHFSSYAPERVPYAIKRYVDETARLYGVLDKRLDDRAFVAGDYTIADMAIYPWIIPHKNQGQNLNDFPNVKRWFAAMSARPAVKRAYARGKELTAAPAANEDSRTIRFGRETKAAA